MLLVEHDAVETVLAQTLRPAQRILVLLVALMEVGLPVFALHVVAIGCNDKLLLVGQFEIHDNLLFAIRISISVFV